MTREEWFRSEVQTDIANYLVFLAANTDPVSGDANSNTFEFTAFDLSVREFEYLQIFVDGTLQDPVDELPEASGEAMKVNEDDTVTAFVSVLSYPLSGSVLDNDNVPDLIRDVRLISDVSEGVLVFSPGLSSTPDGSFSFDPAKDFEDLPAGHSPDVTFVYEVEDADGDTVQATVTITVTGTNDAPQIGIASLSAGMAEAIDGTPGEDSATHSADGTIAFSDVDSSDSVSPAN